MEDSIIFALIERSQFALNSVVYESNAIPVPGFDADGRRYSLLEYFLRETEQSHGRIRRYTSPDEHAFFPDDLPKLVLPPIQFPNLLHACAEDININDDVMALYVGELLPRIAGGGGGDGPSDDGNHGSAALSDINVLQAMSKRVHYGKFVAEAKFCGPQRTEYERLIAQKDADAIMRLLTDESVERRVVQRVRNKAAVFGSDIQDVMGSISTAPRSGEEAYGKIKPEEVAQLYKDWIMPLNKKVQVQYLMQRLD